MMSKFLDKSAKFGALREEKLPLKMIFLLCLSGAVVGFLNGFFGGGGGMIVVPLLENVLHLESKYSHATAIVIIFPISFISAIIYLLSGSIENLSLITVGLGVVAGGIVGSFVLKVLPPKALKIIFALLMLAGGIRLIV